jgi:hypothetical protein
MQCAHTSPFVCDTIDEYKREPMKNIGKKNRMKNAITFVTAALLAIQVAGVCHEHCQWCERNVCNTCRHNLYLYNGTCVDECPANYIPIPKNWNFRFGRMIGNKCELPLSIENTKMVGWGDAEKGANIPLDIASSGNIKAIFSNEYAFAALTTEHSIVAWGTSYYGGNLPPDVASLNNVKTIFATKSAFAALTTESKVISWGGQTLLSNSLRIKSIFSTSTAFAALTNESTIVAWGNPDYGGDVPANIASLKNVTMIFSTTDAFAALTNESKLVAWGSAGYGNGDLPPSIASLTNIKTVFSNEWAFAALTSAGNVVAWGASNMGGNIPSTIASLSNIQTIFPSSKAFAALTNSGNVVAWGLSQFGGDIPSNIASLNNIKTIFSTDSSFAALTTDSKIVGWSQESQWTVPANVASLNTTEIIHSNIGAFAILTQESKVLAWGTGFLGGTLPSEIASLTNVQRIYSNAEAFSALTESRIVSWGKSTNGGFAPLSVSSPFQNVHRVIGSSPYVFLAIKSCDNETYADINDVCQLCDNGKSTNGALNNIGKETCQDCLPGYVRSNENNDIKCQPCQAKQYQKLSGKEVCNDITPGFYLSNCLDLNSQLGCANASMCEPGYACSNGNKTICQVGETSERGSRVCEPYSKKYWYWEIVEMIRKVFLCGGLIAIASGSSLQIIIAILVQFIYILIIERAMPYKEFHDDVVQLVGSIQLFLTLFIGLILKLQEHNIEEKMSENEANGVGNLLVIINLGIIFAGTFSLYMTTTSGKNCIERWKKRREANNKASAESVKVHPRIAALPPPPPKNNSNTTNNKAAEKAWSLG